MGIPVRMTLVLVKKEDIKGIIGAAHLTLYNQGKRAAKPCEFNGAMQRYP